MSNYVVGIDISKQTFNLAFQLEDAQWREGRYRNEVGEFDRIKKVIPPGSRCLMEASGPYYLPLACWLVRQGYRVSVLNPLVVRRYAQMRLMRVKTDPVDARLIADYGRDQDPPLWKPPKRILGQMRQLQTYQELLTRMRTMLGNQQESLLSSGQTEPWVRTDQQRLIRQLEKRIERAGERLMRLARAHYGQMLARLEQIPGVGSQIAVQMLILTRGFTRFDSAKQLAAYCGLAPHPWQSGKRIRGRGSISKIGHGRMRRLLYMGSWSARRCNPGCRRLYERLKEKGKPGKLISVALAHKLLRQAWAVGHYNRNFDPNWT